MTRCAGYIDPPHGMGAPRARAVLKSVPGDFQVSERLGRQPGNVGEHLYLQIEKVGWETQEVARRLATFYGLRHVDVGFAGYKDKGAVARQWFSVRTASDLAPAGVAGLRVVGRGRDVAKLRRGQHAGNDFVIRLRGLEGADWETRLARIRGEGAPNYFGVQRFAPGALERAWSWLARGGAGRHRAARGEGWYLSVLRSLLFNEVLGARVRAANWNRIIDGDVRAETPSGAPTGPLWGSGRSPVRLDAAAAEREALAPHGAICRGLEQAGLRQARRSLVLRARGLRWDALGDSLKLRFFLPPGGYATTLLREAFVLDGVVR